LEIRRGVIEDPPRGNPRSGQGREWLGAKSGAAAGGRWGLNSRQGQKNAPAGVRIVFSHRGKKDPRRAGTSCPAGSAKKWSRRDGTITFNIRGAPQSGPTVDCPTGQHRSGSRRSGPPLRANDRDGLGRLRGPLTPDPSPARGEGGRAGVGRARDGTGHEFVGCRPGRVAAAGTPVLPAPQEAEGEGIGTGLVGMGRDKFVSPRKPREIGPLTPALSRAGRGG
jgi:hypothetical protein